MEFVGQTRERITENMIEYLKAMIEKRNIKLINCSLNKIKRSGHDMINVQIDVIEGHELDFINFIKILLKREGMVLSQIESDPVVKFTIFSHQVRDLLERCTRLSDDLRRAEEKCHSYRKENDRLLEDNQKLGDELTLSIKENHNLMIRFKGKVQGQVQQQSSKMAEQPPYMTRQDRERMKRDMNIRIRREDLDNELRSSMVQEESVDDNGLNEVIY